MSSNDYTYVNIQKSKFIYQNGLKFGRCPLLEDILLKNSFFLVEYARDVIKGRWLEAENEIRKYSNSSYLYARDVLKRRWPEAENTIASDAKASYYYAKDVVKGRWIEGEEEMLKLYNHQCCFDYACEVMKKRWSEAEDKICKVEYRGLGPNGKISDNKAYLLEKYIYYFPEEELDIYLNVLEKDINNIDNIKPRKDIQEKILMLYPYLANRIYNLDLQLAKKYSNMLKISDLGVV